MEISEYIQQAIRTEGDPRDLVSKWNAEQHSIGVGYADPNWADPVRLIHSAIGLETEIHELDFEWDGSQENLIEELGDICWYAAIAMNALPESGVIGSSFHNEYNNYMARLSMIFDHVRIMALEFTNDQVTDIMAKNIAKLQKRFPDRFTHEAANDRADKKTDVSCPQCSSEMNDAGSEGYVCPSCGYKSPF